MNPPALVVPFIGFSGTYLVGNGVMGGDESRSEVELDG
jgi:hypothetical protein